MTKKKTKKIVINKWWLIGILTTLFLIAVTGKIYGGLIEDRFCQTTHVPTTQPPKDLKTATDWLTQGDVDYESGNCELAIESLNKAIKLDPNYAEAYNNRGFIKSRLKMYSESLIDFNKAIELRPNYPHALMNRGDVYNRLENKVKALADFDRVMAMGKQLVKSEAVCGRREMIINKDNFIKALWNGLWQKDECWKMYWER